MVHFIRALALLAVAAPLVLASQQAAGEDFRIESRVFLKAAPKPITENLTLFHAGRVYDVMVDTAEITVFDPPRARFLVFDTTRKVQTEVKLADVDAFMARLRQQAKTADNEFLNFLADPQFELQFDRKTGVLSMTSQWMVYSLTTIDAPNSEIVEQYSQFSDWYAKLSAMTTPGKIPPFARLAVNAELKKNEQIPRDVRLTLHLKDEVSLRSEHKVHWKLLESDLEKIRQVDDYHAKFQAVSREDYYRTEDEPVARKDKDKNLK